jgi:hypothetical protein
VSDVSDVSDPSTASTASDCVNWTDCTSGLFIIDMITARPTTQSSAPNPAAADATTIIHLGGRFSSGDGRLDDAPISRGTGGGFGGRLAPAGPVSFACSLEFIAFAAPVAP